MPAKKKQTTGAHTGRPSKAEHKMVGSQADHVVADDERRHALVALGKQAVAETKGSFVKIDTDSKGQVSLGAAVVEKGMAREYARTLIGMKPLRVNLVREITTVTVTANTAMAVSSPVDYTSCTEYSSWAALFDEVRAISYLVRSNVGVGASALPTAGVMWAGAISPAINTAPSSIAQTVGFTRFVGPVPANAAIGFNGTVVVGSSIAAVSNHGTTSLGSGPLVKGVTTNNSGGTMTVNPVQGNWVPTGTNSAHAGYVLLYGDAPGAGVSWTYRHFIWVTLEFRSRSG